MRFTKMQAMGNDFLILDEAEIGETDPGQLAVAMCDRHFGAGADGIILLKSGNGDCYDHATRIFNSDGGEAEVSGNGTRCVGAVLALGGRGQEAAGVMRIATAAGVKRLRLVARVGLSALVEMDMGEPILETAAIPFQMPEPRSPVIDYPIEAVGETFAATVTSMGNPHCSLFFDDLDAVDVRRIGPAIEHHAAFPNRTNVEFVQVQGSDRIRVVFWERGAGETLSSGTGSSAAAVASILGGKTGRSVTVTTPAGDLYVHWRESDGHVLLTGPAGIVYRGEWFHGSDPPAR